MTDREIYASAVVERARTPGLRSGVPIWIPATLSPSI